MELKQLGSTSIPISPIGLGTVKFGRNQGVKYPTRFELPSDDDIKKLLALCLELGINLIDTAPAYGISEERLGKLLPGPRSQWVIMSKAGEEFQNGDSSYCFEKSFLISSVERSLQRLKTDYLDCVLVHSNGDDEKIILEDEALATLAQLKEKGLIRSFGMSTKTVRGGLLALEQSDVVMATYNPLYTEEKPVLDRALEINKGIFIKKGLLSGHLQALQHTNPIQASMDFIFQHPAVTSIITGTINPAHLQENVQVYLHTKQQSKCL